MEAESRGQPPGVRRGVRQALDRQRLEERAWLADVVGKVSVKSELAKANGYCCSSIHSVNGRFAAARFDASASAAGRQ
jgi:hypothetical protein